MENRYHVLMTQFLSAATDIHTVMCRLNADNGLQTQLNMAMQSVLIGAEECRKGLYELPPRSPKDDDIPF